jgi:hypothetical protein
MENVLIRECTQKDIDEVLQLDRQWEQEDIAHEFMFVSREDFISVSRHECQVVRVSHTSDLPRL